MATFRLEIATPERVVFSDDVTSVSIPTIDGEITVLAHHVPVVTVLKPGELTIRKDSRVTPFAVAGGFIEVTGQTLRILADSAERFDEIDEQRAEEARRRAEELKTQVTANDEEFAAVAAKLERELARLHVVRKHRSHSGPEISRPQE